MPGNKVFADHQAKPCPLLGLGSLGGEIGIGPEQLAEVVAGNAHAVVRYRELYLTIAGEGHDGDLPPPVGVLYGVGDQVTDDGA